MRVPGVDDSVSHALVHVHLPEAPAGMNKILKQSRITKETETTSN